MILLQLIINSLIIGSIYALVACGFSLIYSTNRFVHFAHGSSVAASAYLCYYLAVRLQIDFWLGVMLTLIFAGIIGALMYRGLYLPLQKRNSSNVILLIASVALLILIENIILLLAGANVKTFSGTRSSTVQVLSTSITTLQITIILVALLLVGLLYWFMTRTRMGVRMRAVADNKELAKIIGIDARKMATYGFVIGSILAGVAGILVALEQNLEPAMGTNLMIKGFTGAIIGGVTSVPASIFGSLILGFAENFGIWFIPSGYKDAIAFGLLFVFLIFRPTGLFGISKGVRK